LTPDGDRNSLAAF